MAGKWFSTPWSEFEAYVKENCRLSEEYRVRAVPVRGRVRGSNLPINRRVRMPVSILATSGARTVTQLQDFLPRLLTPDFSDLGFKVKIRKRGVRKFINGNTALGKLQRVEPEPLSEEEAEAEAFIEHAEKYAHHGLQRAAEGCPEPSETVPEGFLRVLKAEHGLSTIEKFVARYKRRRRKPRRC